MNKKRLGLPKDRVPNFASAWDVVALLTVSSERVWVPGSLWLPLAVPPYSSRSSGGSPEQAARQRVSNWRVWNLCGVQRLSLAQTVMRKEGISRRWLTIGSLNSFRIVQLIPLLSTCRVTETIGPTMTGNILRYLFPRDS